mmetsp:Transcript_10487/g.36237  ORF Transcript_10487/g.36237 Transcript_10487/m.36237 type:complete len:241 (-) Transcript_10487:706-1428(-)
MRGSGAAAARVSSVMVCERHTRAAAVAVARTRSWPWALSSRRCTAASARSLARAMALSQPRQSRALTARRQMDTSLRSPIVKQRWCSGGAKDSASPWRRMERMSVTWRLWSSLPLAAADAGSSPLTPAAAAAAAGCAFGRSAVAASAAAADGTALPAFGDDAGSDAWRGCVSVFSRPRGPGGGSFRLARAETGSSSGWKTKSDRCVRITCVWTQAPDAPSLHSRRPRRVTPGRDAESPSG